MLFSNKTQKCVANYPGGKLLSLIALFLYINVLLFVLMFLHSGLSKYETKKC